jgi:hypothetical protein
MFDHAFERPGLRALLQIKWRVEIEAVFALDMCADERRIGDRIGLVLDRAIAPSARPSALPFP